MKLESVPGTNQYLSLRVRYLANSGSVSLDWTQVWQVSTESDAPTTASSKLFCLFELVIDIVIAKEHWPDTVNSLQGISIGETGELDCRVITTEYTKGVRPLYTTVELCLYSLYKSILSMFSFNTHMQGLAVIARDTVTCLILRHMTWCVEMYWGK